ncbi:hypothetical protein [Cellulophaga sp. L1A9]|uniref:hypothetical protein n=1 Tax=Cellulophaga sp. L1A9 TaxID=2686362 RepID=UPI00131D7EAF|nr:hypothetical protein [Cellulophaga sp. L1A9]
MFGGGSGAGMAQMHRNNIKLLRKTNRFSSKRTFSNTKIEYSRAAGGFIALKKLSPEELRSVRKLVLENRNKDKRKNLLLSLAILVPLLTLFAYLISAFLANENTIKSNNLKLKADVMSQQYDFYKSDGDVWFNKNKFNNAIFQYRKAQELFPEKYEANYQLTKALVRSCQIDFLHCEEAKEKLEILKGNYPDKKDILVLHF